MRSRVTQGECSRFCWVSGHCNAPSFWLHRLYNMTYLLQSAQDFVRV